MVAPTGTRSTNAVTSSRVAARRGTDPAARDTTCSVRAARRSQPIASARAARVYPKARSARCHQPTRLEPVGTWPACTHNQKRRSVNSAERMRAVSAAISASHDAACEARRIRSATVPALSCSTVENSRHRSPPTARTSRSTAPRDRSPSAVSASNP
ncbi:MAG: hypothetical protein F4Z35_02805 [Dehalococcoidia bacterium]|nr:hypothetical protein [Dehalococcoidia bacterium]